jgi:FAD/FMN-containing dehydrogenase
VLRCSRDAHADVFWATVGGMGLTGMILDVRLRLRAVETSWLRVDYRKARDLEDTLGVFAASDAGSPYSVAWIDCLARGRAMGRAVIMGPQNPGLLSFPREGYTLALDVPVRPGLVEFLHALDRLVLEHGGRVYLAKDATTTAASVRAMYPRLDEFRAVKARLDPRGVLSSSLARRVGLV